MTQSFTGQGNTGTLNLPVFNGGRLTLTSATPVADASAQGTIYWTPYKHGSISLYNGTNYQTINSSEVSLAISNAASAVSGSVYDVFGYLSAGAMVLETLVWSSTTARATSVNQDSFGVYSKSTDRTRRYLGTFYASGTNQITDDTTIRGLWNVDNKEERPLLCSDGTNTWTYNSTTWRSANSSTTYGTGRVGAVVGLSGLSISFNSMQSVDATLATSAGCVGIGINSTTVSSGLNTFGNPIIGGVYGITSDVTASIYVIRTLGFSYYQRLECVIAGSNNCTFYGDNNVPMGSTTYTTQSGMGGVVEA